MTIKRTAFAAAIFGVFALAAYGFLIEPDRLEIQHLEVRTGGSTDVLKGKTAVQLSDLHLHKIGEREEKILKVLDEVKPDFIFLTGDYIPWKGDVGPALEFLSRLHAKTGVWAVMGDYDYSRSRESCLFCHEPGSGRPTKRHGVHFLRDNAERVRLARGDLWIGGIDGIADRPFASLDDVRLKDGRGPDIILVHNPMEFDRIKDEGALVLAGDTHGGQIPLPSRLWGILGYKKVERYSQGLFRRGRNEMYVSRGVGTSHASFRFLRRPEIVVIHFK